MAKSELTLEVERTFLDFLEEKREMAVPESVLGHHRQHGVVDILTYTGKSKSNGRGRRRSREVTMRCYEIKVSKADFFSKSKWSFVGDYNYFVMPIDLYRELEKEIPPHVGVFAYWGTQNGKGSFTSVKRATKQAPKIETSEFVHEFIVSLYRDARRWQKSGAYKRK